MTARAAGEKLDAFALIVPKKKPSRLSSSIAAIVLRLVSPPPSSTQYARAGRNAPLQPGNSMDVKDTGGMEVLVGESDIIAMIESTTHSTIVISKISHQAHFMMMILRIPSHVQRLMKYRKLSTSSEVKCKRPDARNPPLARRSFAFGLVNSRPNNVRLTSPLTAIFLCLTACSCDIVYLCYLLVLICLSVAMYMHVQSCNVMIPRIYLTLRISTCLDPRCGSLIN